MRLSLLRIILFISLQVAVSQARATGLVILLFSSYLKSQNETVTLRLQEDGGLVLPCLGSPIQSSVTHGNADIKSLVFQENCNLALIKDDTNVAWSTNIQDSDGTYLVVENDGNFVFLSGDNLPIWTSNTGGKCEAAGTSRIFKSVVFEILQITNCPLRTSEVNLSKSTERC